MRITSLEPESKAEFISAEDSSSARENDRQKDALKCDTAEDSGGARQNSGGIIVTPVWLPTLDWFLAKVDKSGPVPPHRPELGPCWLWTGGKTEKRYGLIREGHAGPRHLAHRVSWRLLVGEIPEGAFVLHHCDVPPCIRPEHLFLGDHAANMADMAAKGRCKEQRGRRHALTRLTEADVVAMRQEWARGDKLKDIAARRSISESTASYIVNGRTWTHVPMATPRVELRAPSNDSAKESA